MEVIYRTYGKEFTSKKEALEYEKEQIKNKCKFNVGDEVFFLDKIDCRLMKSYVVKIWINEFDKEFYANVAEYSGVIKVSELYNQLPPLIYDLRQNIFEAEKPDFSEASEEIQALEQKHSDAVESGAAVAAAVKQISDAKNLPTESKRSKDSKKTKVVKSGDGETQMNNTPSKTNESDATSANYTQTFVPLF